MNSDKLCINCMFDEKTTKICPKCGFNEENYIHEKGFLTPKTMLYKRYFVGKVISSDDFFTQYLGWDTVNNCKVVIEELFSPEFATRDENNSYITVSGDSKMAFFNYANLKFKEEAKRFEKLKDHPNIEHYVDNFKENNTVYRVREYVEGVTVKSYFEQKNWNVSQSEAVKMIKIVIKALIDAHENEIFHHNISERTVLIDKNGQIRLVGSSSARFSIASMIKEKQTADYDGFFPTEINLKNFFLRESIDVFGVGKLMLYIITGSDSDGFTNINYSSKIEAMFTNESKLYRFKNIILKSLNPNPKERYKNLKELHNDLEMLIHIPVDKISDSIVKPTIKETANKQSVKTEASNEKIVYDKDVPAKNKMMGILNRISIKYAVIIIMAILSIPVIFYITSKTGITKFDSKINNAITEKSDLSDVDIILRLHGSNTIGAKLSPAIAELYLKKIGAEKTFIKKLQKEEEITVIGKMSDSGDYKGIEIFSHGSGTAFDDLGGETCDIGCSSRRVKKQEVDKLSRFGDMYSFSNEHVLAMDGIAIIINKSNPISNINKSQLAKIFAGEINDWSQVDKNFSGKISIYARDDKSGTYDTFKSMILGHDLKLSSTAKRFESSGELSDSVSNDKFGIGFIGLPYIKNAKSVAVSEEGTASLLPTKFTVATEDYPLARRLFLYTPEMSKNKHVNAFVELALSREGQDIVEKIGFIPMVVEKTSPIITSTTSSEYSDAVKGSERLSLNFRFHSGSSMLDNKAMRDLDRLVDYFSKDKSRKNKIVLVGFADNLGGENFNRKLSYSRAKVVEEELVKRGINISKIYGLGSLEPVASNKVEDGREKNRRVEIWVNK